MSNANSAINNDPFETEELDNTTPVIESADEPVIETEEAEPAPDAKGARAAAARALKDIDVDEPAAGALPKLDGLPKTEAAKPKQEIDPITGRVLEPIKPPASMSPELREQFGQVPRRMQQYWVDREKHIATELGKTTEARKFYEEFRGITQPYEGLLKHHNITATAHAKELFQLSHSLNTGTPEQKAYVFVQLLNQFKPDAATMQAMLAGQQVNIRPPTVPQRQYTQDELADMALAKRTEEQQNQSAQSETERFGNDSANEFYADVKHTMGQLIDTGVIPESDIPTMLRQAYDLAVSRHSGIQEVLAARKGAVPGQRAQQAPLQPLQHAQAPAAAARPTPSVKPSVGGGVQRASQNRKFSSSREAARAALEANGWLDD